MLSVLSEKSFRNLFFAQNFSLLGNGLATIAISLLAFDLAGRNAALILSGLFTIKMLIYVIFSPFAGAIADKFDTKKYNNSGRNSCNCCVRLNICQRNLAFIHHNCTYLSLNCSFYPDISVSNSKNI